MGNLLQNAFLLIKHIAMILLLYTNMLGIFLYRKRGFCWWLNTQWRHDWQSWAMKKIELIEA